MIYRDVRSQVALICVVLLLGNLRASAGRKDPPPVPAAAARALEEEVKKSYLTLFETASRLEYSKQQTESLRKYLKQAEDYCVDRFRETSKNYQRQVDEAQRELRKENISEARRHELHCKIQDGRALKSQADLIAQHAIPVAYANKLAKLDLIEQWPEEEKRIRRSIEDESYRKRRWADVEDIGFRKLEEDQADDVKLGQQAIEDLKRQGLMPKEMDSEPVNRYVRDLAQKLAVNSDLRVPLQVTVLDSKEVNAFALPGGFVYVERGLLEAVEDESQLAGVIAHEMSHVVLRHGRKLMRKATIASIFYQIAQVAAILLTGGAAGLGTYYAIQYSFFGVGMALELALIGVSRDFEREADQLGVQYAWKSGYDPGGFIRFFDKMATTEGYVNGASWFRTHPPFYQRMVDSQREIMYLGRKPAAIVTTTEFARMKEALKPISERAEREAQDQRKKPSLLSPEEGCPQTGELIYEADQPIETICASPQVGPAKSKEKGRAR